MAPRIDPGGTTGKANITKSQGDFHVGGAHVLAWGDAVTGMKPLTLESPRRFIQRDIAENAGATTPRIDP